MGKRLRRDYRCGFEDAVIEAPKFAKLLALNGLTFTNRKLVDGKFIWGFADGYIVTTNDPLTGTYMNNQRTNRGVAGNVGVQGTKKFRDRVAKFLKRNAISETYNSTSRLA